MSAPPVMWRTKLRSTRTDPPVDHAAQVAHCLDKGLIGIGWGADAIPKGAPLEDVLAFIEATPEWGRRAARIVQRFALEAQVGDFVWTRDTSGRYLLGQIAGPYRYDASDEARAVDVYQVRDATWAPSPLNDLDVPGGVIRCFTGTGESFSRIHNPAARTLTAYLWEKLHGRPLPRLEVTRAEVITHLLDPYDVEDLIYVWLQVARGYVVLPRSRQRDMPTYEYSMIHRSTGVRAIAQVKSGDVAVNLSALAAGRADPSMSTYAYATSARYEGDLGAVTEVIDTNDLVQFTRDNSSVLPPRVRTWLELVRE